MWRIIKFQYKDSTRIALEIEPDERKINCIHCLQAVKDGEESVGYRSFKVPEMRDIQPIQGIPEFLKQHPKFLEAVQERLDEETNS